MHAQALRSGVRDQLGLIAALLRPILRFAAASLVVLSISRALLVGWLWDRVTAADMPATVLLQGLRFDLVLLGVLLAPLALLFPLLCGSRRTIRGWSVLLRVYLPLAFLLIVFMEIATPSFVAQFDARPNRLFVEYLVYPREVMSMLGTAYWPQFLLAAVLLPMSFVWMRRRLSPDLLRVLPVRPWLALLVTPLLLATCTAMIRSTLEHRPVNPSTVAVSPDPLANDLALNSAYTVLYAIYEARQEPSGGFRYAAISDDDAIARVRDAMMISPDDFSDPALPTLHHQPSSAPVARPKNLVIILEESLGAEYVGSMGGYPLTPNLDRLRNEGLWFANLYATGTRSVRGIEAVITGFTPTPARSVVKLGKSQRNFFTLAQLLQERGYSTTFMYGGEAHFDNMRRFLVNNGFADVIDQAAIEHPVFVGSWGVSDEDLFRKAHSEFMKQHDQPFFAFLFSVSNHSPYDFPDGRVALAEGEKATVRGAVKYADYSLGMFFDLARQSDYWDDTVFLVVADHNSRVYGAELVPIEHFHIPALVLGGGIGPAVFAPVASQIDLAPTLLSMIGVSADHPMIGHDLTRAEFTRYPGRAIMQYYSTQAYMRGNDVAILRKDLPPEQYRYVDGSLLPVRPADDTLLTEALAHSAWSSLAYDRELYRLHEPVHASD